MNINGLKIHFDDNVNFKEEIIKALREKDLFQVEDLCKNQKHIKYVFYTDSQIGSSIFSSIGEIYLSVYDVLMATGSFKSCVCKISKILEDNCIKFEDPDIYYLFLGEIFPALKENKEAEREIRNIIKIQISRILTSNFIALPEQIWNFK